MRTPTYLLTREEYDEICERLLSDSCDPDCVDNFDYWNFEASRYVKYLTSYSCTCNNIYCNCLTKTERDEVIKESVFWYITYGQRSLNQFGGIEDPKQLTYNFLLENGLIIY